LLDCQLQDSLIAGCFVLLRRIGITDAQGLHGVFLMQFGAVFKFPVVTPDAKD
jgi:hypothetical protein